MYSINAIAISDDLIEMKIYYNRILIGSKKLELNFNENKTPTFVESGYEYLSIEFENFIKNVENLIPDQFSFDDQDRFDGFKFVEINEFNYLVIQNEVNNTNLSVYIAVNTESLKGIILDLKAINSVLNKTIEKQLNYYNKLENPLDED